ncbi:MAG: glucose-1-phosphate cytidylyltransferase [Alphaproteobacteria bacterium]|nr:glucose-1-phosphate cytidylyltransferase [Alphaproteobacteria bacterium]
MKTVILAGGFGTRLSEETDLRPKPLVEIGGRPILWHIMKLYARHGLKDFVVCCGYKGADIKRYFANYLMETSDVTFDFATNAVSHLSKNDIDWKVTLVDTGLDSMTGGRLKRVAHLVQGGTFCLTYGDGVSDIDIGQLIAFHRAHGKAATVTAVPSPGRFGILDLDKANRVTRFHEKPDNEMGWINGGFFVLEPRALAHIDDDRTIWEREPLERLAAAGELSAFRHTGFWQPMDTLRDKRALEALWASGKAPWKSWD